MGAQTNRSTLFNAQVIFRSALLPFIVQKLKEAYGKQWWDRGVARVFREEDIQRWKRQYRRRHPKPAGEDQYSDDELQEILDLNHFPNIFQGNWKAAFRPTLSNRDKFLVWLREIVAMRNLVAHPTSDDVTFDDTWRALDTMSRLLRAIDKSAARQIDEIKCGLRENTRNAVRPPAEPPAQSPLTTPLTEFAEESVAPTGSLLSLEQKTLLAEIIEHSGRVNTPYQRNALLEEIGLNPGRMEVGQGPARDFALNLVGLLNRAMDQSTLEKLVEVMNDPSLHQSELKTIEVALRETELAERSDETPLALPPQLAFPLQDTSVRLRPLDLGMIWGLNRGSFIGVLSGWKVDGIYQRLTYTEQILRMAQQQLKSPPPSPQRRWQRLTLGNSPNCIAPDRNVGVMLEIDDGEFDSAHTIQDWCRSSLNHIPSGRQIAIVIHVAGKSIRQSRKQARRIHAILEQSDLPFPTDLVTLDYQPRSIGKLRTSAAADLLLEQRPSQGVHFCLWVKKAFEGTVVRPSEIQKRYPLVISAYRDTYRDDFESVPEFVGSAIEVVRDLESLASIKGHELYTQFLDLIADYFPQRLYQLIGSYSISSQKEARRCALIFSNKHRSDTLFDAWVKGVETDLGLVPRGRALIADPETGSFLEGLVLALLRSYKRGTHGVKETLNEIRPSLTRPLEVVSGFCLADIKEEDFLRNNSDTEFLLAVRAGATFDLPCSVEGLTLDSSDLWWLLFAVPPSIRLIKAVLQQGVRERAVFGLCSPEEWKEIGKARSVRRRISDCRRGCEVYYR